MEFYKKCLTNKNKVTRCSEQGNCSVGKKDRLGFLKKDKRFIVETLIAEVDKEQVNKHETDINYIKSKFSKKITYLIHQLLFNLDSLFEAKQIDKYNLEVLQLEDEDL